MLHISGYDLCDDADFEAISVDETVERGKMDITSYFGLGLRSMLTIVSQINAMSISVNESQVCSFLINLDKHSSKIAYGLQNAKAMTERVVEKVGKCMAETKKKCNWTKEELNIQEKQLEENKRKLDELRIFGQDIQCKVLEHRHNVRKAEASLQCVKNKFNQLSCQIGEHHFPIWFSKDASPVAVGYSNEYQSAQEECKNAKEKLYDEILQLKNAYKETKWLSDLIQQAERKCKEMRVELEGLENRLEKMHSTFKKQSKTDRYFKKCLHIISIASDGANLFEEQMKSFYNIKSITGPLKSLSKMFQGNQLDVTYRKDIDLDSINWNEFDVKLNMLSSAPAEWKTGKYLITSRNKGVCEYLYAKSIRCL